MSTELPLKTYEARKNYVKLLGERLGTDISNKEWFEIVYHWMAFELALVKERAISRRVDKHRDWLNEMFAVLDMRQDLDEPF
jgi:hypothetical protein